MAVFFVVALTVIASFAHGATLTSDSKQIILCLALNDTSSEGTLQLFHRDKDGHWQAEGKSWAVLFGRHGMAWGRGLHPDQSGPQKVNGDGKNPEGVFKIGTVYGYADKLPDGAHDWPYHQVTNRDAWIDDPKLGLPYNHLYTLPKDAPYPPWWQKEYMHLDDAAYQWLILIEHNYADPVPSSGNEIYFHVRRGEHYRTAGCTTMRLEDLEHVVKWLNPDAKPLLAELTQSDYQRLWKEWDLPPPAP